jgi:bifunctional DNase/RNase
MLVELEKVKIKRIIGPTPSGAAVLLGNEQKTFVVFVGFYEAAALIREINNEVPARPLTHELIQNVFLGFDVEVKQVIISTIIENTFCATLILEQKGREGNGAEALPRNEVRIDARPSDCFVLALKNKVDIFVTKEVFEQVQDVSKMTEEVEGNLAAGNLGGMGLGNLEFELSGSESGGEEESPEEDPFLGGEEESGGEEEEPSEEDDEEDYKGFKP